MSIGREQEVRVRMDPPLTAKVGFVSVQVEFDGLHLGQVAMLRVLVCVTVGPGIHQEQTLRVLATDPRPHRKLLREPSLRHRHQTAKILTMIKIRRAVVTRASCFWFISSR